MLRSHALSPVRVFGAPTCICHFLRRRGDVQTTEQRPLCCLQNIPDAEAAARKLTDEAFSRGSNDNISCVVVKCVLGCKLVT